MSLEWTEVKIDDVGKIVTGKTPKTSIEDNYGGDIPFITPVDMVGNRNAFITERYISKKGLNTVKNCYLPENAICISCIGSDMGKAVITVKPSVTNQQINSIIVDEDSFDYLYVYYLMRTLEEEIRSLGKNATAVPILNKTKFSNIEISVFEDIKTQRAVSSILSAYDNLIENNQKQIKLLEEAVQRLYKEWFVDLRFPGYENTPIVDCVPEGWERLSIGELIETIPRTTQILASDYGKEGFIPIIDQSRDFIAGYTNNQSALVDLGKPVIVFGDHTRILKYIQFPFAKGADGTQLIVSNRDNMPQSLFYCSLVGVDLSNYHYARHFKYLKAENILVPTQEIADAFDGFVAPIFTEVQRLRDIIKNAAEARDRLLPKLMSGEIDI